MKRALAIGLAAVLLLAGSAALGQSFNDPEGTPLGCTDRSGQGQKLPGFAVVEFVGVGAGSIATSARVTVRLSDGKATSAFFGVVAGPLDTNDFEAVRDAIVAALESDVKGEFFAEACGDDGLACPSVTAIVRCFDNVALTDDGGQNLIMAADVVIQMSERL
jgi:hypothetical protein